MNVRALFAVLVVASVAWLPSVASAHEVRPAYLDIEQTSPDRYTVVWKAPAAGEFALHLVPHLSNGWLEKAPSDQFGATGFLIRTWKIREGRADPLKGNTVRIEGLDKTITDVLVRVRFVNGNGMDAIVRPDHPALALDFARHGDVKRACRRSKPPHSRSTRSPGIVAVVRFDIQEAGSTTNLCSSADAVRQQKQMSLFDVAIRLQARGFT